MYNQEAETMAVINTAHKCKGIFKGSKQAQNGIYLDIIFEDRVWRKRFTNVLNYRNIGKKVLVLTDSQCSVLV